MADKYYRHIMELLKTNKNLKSTFEGTDRQMVGAIAGTAFGGIVGGPEGALACGVAGGCLGYLTADSYKSMIDVLQNLSEKEIAELVAKIQKLVGSVAIEALTQFIAQKANHNEFLKVVKEFAK